MRGATILLCILLTGCGIGDRAPPNRPPASRPPVVAAPTDRETDACFADLARAGVRYSPIPDRDFGSGCSLIGAVQLSDVGVPVSGLKGMRCALARGFTGWARFALIPAARQILGSDLVRVETLGSYACRNTIGTAPAYTRRSGHAIGNAVDVSAFILADGRRITVRDGWRSRDTREREFMRIIHASACKRFGTVLSPDYNAAHYDHLHLEDDRAVFAADPFLLAARAVRRDR